MSDFSLPASLRGPAWQTKDACYKLVSTTSKALGQPIWLRNGPYGCTDGRYCNVPLADPEAYLISGHELSHIVFGSNIEAMVHFCDKLASRITTDFLARGDRTLSGHKEALKSFIHHIVNILDDNRVAYWWGQFNPGDYELLVARWKRIGSENLDGAKTDFFQFMLSCMFDMAPTDADPDFLSIQPAIEQAYLDCISSDFVSCMAASAKLMTKLTKILGDAFAKKQGMGQPGAAGGTPDPDQGQSAGGAVQVMMGGSPDPADAQLAQAAALRLMALLGQGDCDVLKSQGHSDMTSDGFIQKKMDSGRMDPGAMQQAEDAMGGGDILSDEDLQNAATAAMQQTLQSLQHGPEEAPDKDEWLKEDAKGKVVFHDIPDSQLVSRVMSEEDRSIANRLHSHFVKIRGKKQNELEHEGSLVDIQAAVQRRISREGPIFRNVQPAPGFEYLLLLDGSGSVMGNLFEQEARAALQLGVALNFPSVVGKCWVYYGGFDSEVVISRLPYPLRKMPANNDGTILGGSTPSHTALRVAAREMMTCSGVRQLIHLTDGAPTGSGAKTHVRRNIAEAMREGIQVHTLYVGGGISYEDALFMSHSTKNFVQCTREDAGQALVDLGKKLFHQYLTGKSR